MSYTSIGLWEYRKTIFIQKVSVLVGKRTYFSFILKVAQSNSDNVI